MLREYNIGEIVFHVHSGTPYEIIGFNEVERKYAVRESDNPNSTVHNISPVMLSIYFERLSGKKFAKGGDVDYFDFDRKMALIYLDEIYQYALKLDRLITEQTDLEDWVKMKITRVEQSIADVNRSLKGWKKFSTYGQGGVIVKSQLKHIADYSKELLEMVKSGAKLMSWQEAKIAISGETLDSLFHRLDYSLGSKKFADGGVIRRFDRHAEMSAETRHEILDLIKKPYDDKLYDKLEAQGLSFMEYENYLYGLYDGYDYSQTKRFKDTFAKVKKASLPLYKRIMKVYDTVGNYNFYTAE